MSIQYTHKHQNQAGMVAIFVTMMLMIVIALIVLTFSSIIRREQQQVLDRQLSTQAFYAAESGINDAAAIIETEAKAGNVIPAKTACATPVAPSDPYSTLNQKLDANTGVEYTCLLVDPDPTKLPFDNVQSLGKIIPLETKSGLPFKTITLNWSDTLAGAGRIGTCPVKKFPIDNSASYRCPIGMLRVDIVKTSGLLTRATLATSMRSFFVTPGSSGTNYTLPSALVLTNVQGDLVTATSCSAPGGGAPATCRLTIDPLTNLGSNKYYMRVRTIYRDSNLTITGTDNANNPVEFLNALALIDSTGKSNDVLRRIQVYRPINAVTKSELSPYGLETGSDLCKKYLVVGNTIQLRGDGLISDNPDTSDSNNPCGVH